MSHRPCVINYDVINESYKRAPASVVIETVGDVGSYSDFVPFCSKSEMSLSPNGEIIGRLTGQVLNVEYSWDSLVRIEGNQVTAVNHGTRPIKKLEAIWSIEPKKNKISKAKILINFKLDPGFSFLETFIERFSDDYVKAFKIEAEKRAKRGLNDPC
jgi:ribosome-associated toxin RatA of RatAB toxin-antitoxin module